MSFFGANDLKDANASENGLENAASVQVKLQKAQELIAQMNEDLSSITENIQIKKSERERSRYCYGYGYGYSYSYGYNYPMIEERTRGYRSRPFMDSFDPHVDPKIVEQDELIRSMRYKMLHESNCLAEEKKLIRCIREAEEIRESLVSDRKAEKIHYKNDKETNHMAVYRAKIQKLKYHKQEQKKAAEEMKSTCKELQSFQEDLIRLNEKRRRVHRIIYDLVKQQDQVPESRQA